MFVVNKEENFSTSIQLIAAIVSIRVGVLGREGHGRIRTGFIRKYQLIRYVRCLKFD